jgi:hypothetical protein
VDFELAVDADPVLEPSVGFRNDGGKAPTFGGFDFLDEVDAVRVIGSVEKSAEGLESGHPKSPPLRPYSIKAWTPSWTPRRYKLLIPKVALNYWLEGSALTN